MRNPLRALHVQETSPTASSDMHSRCMVMMGMACTNREPIHKCCLISPSGAICYHPWVICFRRRSPSHRSYYLHMGIHCLLNLLDLTKDRPAARCHRLQRSSIPPPLVSILHPRCRMPSPHTNSRRSLASSRLLQVN